MESTISGGVCMTCLMNDEIARTQNFGGVVKITVGKVCAASVGA